MLNKTSTLQVVQRRAGLKHTRRGLEEAKLTIGFLGGSITDPRAGQNWPEPVIGWFIQHFPQLRIAVENAAIGATGSDLAIFRVERDILGRQCNLVFVEYAVNDTVPDETFRRSREGLLRKLLASKTCDVVLVYTFSQNMYQDMLNDRLPASIAEFEALGRHYQIPSVWMGLQALREVMAGAMRWEDWLPDGLHPLTRGSLSYAQSVMQLLEQELIAEPEREHEIGEGELPAPMGAQNWEKTALLPFDAVHLEGPWVIRRNSNLVWIDQMLSTAAVGASLSFSFRGRGLVLGFDFGKDAAEFTYRLDETDWQTMVRDRPDWYFDKHWFRQTLIADDLPIGEHTFELEVTHGDRQECTGTNFALAFIGILL